ncbi:peptidyl-prolyl cis-trans isomerase SurA [Thermodesulfovibrio aggregans]|uniref:Peptidyl-prolyl cis-trans isomerase SurA n=1 Tax=Thermodesulfovibrio aggregans TaxID=86166 RepID=A0A0U9HRF3_9BACT|nr:peptidylprolyl isomerase [Thermodesulfovibrio aggregans]GAQ95614.1 peptidyl-prolyl cis-trans isomerase SurA [Thermodesulfovibrio aggregans]
MFKNFLLFILSIIFFTVSAEAEENKFFVDKVVAVVNREVITWSELYKFMEFNAKDEIKALNPDEKFKYFKAHEEEFLEKLIDTKLQIEEAEKYGIFVSDSEIEGAINEIKRKYNLTDEGFMETLKKEGMSLSDYKKMLKEQIIIGRALNSLVRSKIVVTDSEINGYISAHPELVCDDEGYYVSQIFIKKRESSEELKDKINEVYKRLIQGESFSKVASQLSEDISAKSGGAIGLLKKGEIAKELSNLFSKMNVGQISEPMMTDRGVFIFKLDGVCFRKDSTELINYVKGLLEEERFKKEYKLWTRGLRQRAYIEIMD